MLSTIECETKLKECQRLTLDYSLKAAITRALEWRQSRDYLRQMLRDAQKQEAKLRAILDRALNAKLP